jgi:hypothetical protein
MVNPGHRSTGCATCKARRIMCDEAYPTCSRCVKSKRVCLGYDSPKQNDVQPASLSTQSQLFRINSQWQSLLPQKLPEEQSQWSRPTRTKDHLLTIFAVAAGECTIQSADSETRLFQFNYGSINFVATPALEIIKAGFQSLRENTQTDKARRKEHEEYGMVLRSFREDLSLSPATSRKLVVAFLFALYEVM